MTEYLSDEANINKISIGLLDYYDKHPEVKIEQSKQRKGRTAWNKGMKMPDEFCQKIKETNTGRQSKLKGKKRPEEFCQKMKEISIGRPSRIKGKHKVWNDDTHTKYHYE